MEDHKPPQSVPYSPCPASDGQMRDPLVRLMFGDRRYNW